VQHGHLREHAIARLGYHYAARAVEDIVGNDDTASNGQAMHETTVFFGIGEPGLINTPVEVFLAQLLIRETVAIVAR